MGFQFYGFDNTRFCCSYCLSCGTTFYGFDNTRFSLLVLSKLWHILCAPTFTVEVAVAYCLGYVVALNLFACLKVGNGACHF